MPKTETRRIGLSLGADLCWPAAYEALMGRLDLSIPVSRSRVDFEVERVTVEPYDLRYKPRYDLVIDRLTHWFPMSREWIKKIALMDEVYVFNNPWAIQSMEKHTSYCAMMRLGLPVPETWLVPPKQYPARGEDLHTRDIETVVKRYNRLFQLGEVGREVGYPVFLKPYDGGGWIGVKRATDDAALLKAYDDSGLRLNHVQAGVKDWDLFVRAIGIGPQVNVIKYDPDQPLHDRYRVAFHFMEARSGRRRRGSRASSTPSSAGTSTPSRCSARMESCTPSTMRTRARTRRSPACTSTSRGWSRASSGGRSSVQPRSVGRR